MKTAKMIELERKRYALMDDARSILAEIESAPNDKALRELEKKHDAAMRALDLNKLDIDQEHIDEVDEAARSARRPNMAGEGYGTDLTPSETFARAWSGEDRSGWIDDKGNPIRVLRSNERFATERATGPALGDTVRAMITGPRTEAERRALAEGTSSAGGYTVPTPLAAWFIDRLRAGSVAIRAGAQTVPMSSQTLAIARLETDPTIGWRAENATIATGDPTFGRVLLSAKSLAGIVKFSRELLMDTANAGAMIEEALAKTMALEIDRAAIFGDGTSDSPTGITGTSGINEVSMGTNGAALSSHDKLLDTIYELLVDNAGLPTAMVSHPRTAIALEKLKDGNGLPLIPPPMLKDLKNYITTAAPITETQGTSNNASSIVMGNFADLFIGMREDINIKVLDQLYAEDGQIALAVHARVDVQLAHKASFCRLKGIIPA